MPWQGELRVLTDFNGKAHFQYQVNSEPFLEQVNLGTKFWPVGQVLQDRNVWGKAKCHSCLQCGIKKYWWKVKLHWKSSLFLLQTRGLLGSERNRWSPVSYGFVPHSWILRCLVKHKPHLKCFWWWWLFLFFVFHFRYLDNFPPMVWVQLKPVEWGMLRRSFSSGKQCLFTKILAFYFWQPFFTEFGRQVQKLQVQSNKQIPTTVGTNRCIYMYTYADNVTLVIWKINLGYLPVLCQTFTRAWSEPGELQYISVLWLNSSLLAHAANIKQLKIHVGLWILPLAHPFEWCPTFVVFLYRGGLQKSLPSVTMSLGSSALRKPEKC